MYDLQDWAAVQRVYKQTRSKRATAKMLGMSRNTVRSLLEEKEAPVYKRTVYKSKIDDFKEQIIEWRCEPFLFNGTWIFRECFLSSTFPKKALEFPVFSEGFSLL